jgi:hypothetical protein
MICSSFSELVLESVSPLDIASFVSCCFIKLFSLPYVYHYHSFCTGSAKRILEISYCCIF